MFSEFNVGIAAESPLDVTDIQHKHTHLMESPFLHYHNNIHLIVADICFHDISGRIYNVYHISILVLYKPRNTLAIS